MTGNRSGICWIEHPAGHRIGITARPRSGDWLEDEIARWRADGVDHVFSLLEREEVADLELNDEEALCQQYNIGFHSYPIRDRGVPSSHENAFSIAEQILAFGRAGQGVAIHCRAGIGRAALMAGAALVLAGLTAADALARVAEARRLDVPDTDEQRAWLDTFGERALSDS